MSSFLAAQTTDLFHCILEMMGLSGLQHTHCPLYFFFFFFQNNASPFHGQIITLYKMDLDCNMQMLEFQYTF